MAKNKAWVELEGFREIMEELDELQGDIKGTAEKALVEGKKVATNKILKETTKSKYPARGKYSKGDTRRSIDLDVNVKWEGAKAEIGVGYKFEKSGPTPIMLMYGTPRMKKVQGMYDALYGKKTKKEVMEKEKEIVQKEIEKRLGQ